MIKLPKIKRSKLLKMKGKDLPDSNYFICNECGKSTTVAIYCCPVKGNPDKGLGNFKEIVIWYNKQKVMEVINDTEERYNCI